MMAVMCLFTVATVWHDEPMKFHVCPPTGTQVREYVAVRGRHPSGTQAQIPVGKVVPSLPSVSPTLKGATTPLGHLGPQ